MPWQIALAIIFSAFIVLLLLGVPIAVSMGIVGMGFMIFLMGDELSRSALGISSLKVMTNYGFLTIPLFILMGEFMLAGGVVEDIFNVASKWLNRLPGGLAVVGIGSCAIFAACSGSNVACATSIGKMVIPQMMNRGYDKRLATGAVVASGGLAMLIPPSIIMIIYASFLELPVGEMLMAGFIPGFILAGGYIIVAVVWALARPSAAPREPDVSWRERFAATKKVAAPLAIILAVLGSIYFGVTTVNEAAGIGVVVTFIIFLVRRGFHRAGLEHAITQSLIASGFVIFIIVGAQFFSWTVNYFKLPQHILDYAVTLSLPPLALIGIFMIVYFILGMFLDAAGQIFITMPIILPILRSFGLSPIWFGILFLIVQQIGTVSPPYGILLFVVKGISPPQVSFKDVLMGYARAFFFADISTLILVMVFPSLALWLPSRMSGG